MLFRITAVFYAPTSFSCCLNINLLFFVFLLPWLLLMLNSGTYVVAIPLSYCFCCFNPTCWKQENNCLPPNKLCFISISESAVCLMLFSIKSIGSFMIKLSTSYPLPSLSSFNNCELFSIEWLEREMKLGNFSNILPVSCSHSLLTLWQWLKFYEWWYFCNFLEYFNNFLCLTWKS